MKLSEVKTEGNFKILIYGNSGTGKTVFAAGAPYPILYLDFDNKVDSAALFYKQDPERLDQIDVRQLGSSLVSNPIEQLEKIITTELIPQAKTGTMKFKTLVLDSLTTFSAQTLKYIVDSNPGVNRVTTKQGKQPGMVDYGILGREFVKLIPGLLELPCNVIMLGHISVEKDELTGELTRGPLMDGAFAKKLPIYFKEVYRSYVDDKGQYLLQTKSDSKFACRSQITGLPNPVIAKFSELEQRVR